MEVLKVFGPILNILQVIIGIGFVIFIHELGHFLMAKWNGVKVEKFALGFFTVLISYRKGMGFQLGSSVAAYEKALQAEKDGIQPKDVNAYGETEYSIRILPLGGFVKMLGEEGEDAQAADDPRAYPNRPVWRRMLIISAGVVMNLIFGVLCNAWPHYRGHDEQRAVIGQAIAGQPAYSAGLRPGDEVVALDGRRDISYKDLMMAAVLSGHGQVLHLELKRPGVSGPVTIDVAPLRSSKAANPQLGILASESLILSDPAYRAPASLPGTEAPAGLEKGKQVVAAGPVGAEAKPVSSILELDAILARERSRPLRVTLDQPKDKATDESPGKSAGHAGPRTVTLPAVPFVDLGLRMTPGPVAAIRKGSPAEAAGFEIGDRIVSVNGRTDFDPMRLPDLLYEQSGRTVPFEILRGKESRRLSLSPIPDDSPIWIATPFLRDEPLDLPGLGLALTIEPKVASVVPGSPAAKARLKAGDVLASLTIFQADPKTKAAPPEAKEMELSGDKAYSWPSVFAVLQDIPADQVKITLAGGREKFVLTPAPVKDWYNPNRGLNFWTVTVHVPPQTAVESLQRGWRDTWEIIVSIPALIRGIFTGRMSKDNVGGILGIARISYQAAQMGPEALIGLLGMLSINLAVFNFLPIPPLDGGQFMFLLGEMVYGRKLPDKFVWYPTILGLVLILCLFVFTFINDIWNMIRPG